MAIANWAERVEYYQGHIKEVRILPTMEGQDIRNVVAALDEVINEAFFDLSEVQADYEAANAELQTKLAEYFLEGKDTPDSGSRGGGMSDEKAKSYSRVKAAEGGEVALKLEAERRLTFMENVVSLLKEKRSLLVISYGTVKFESDLVQ
jgi:hypothetical protein